MEASLAVAATIEQKAVLSGMLKPDSRQVISAVESQGLFSLMDTVVNIILIIPIPTVCTADEFLCLMDKSVIDDV